MSDPMFEMSDEDFLKSAPPAPVEAHEDNSEAHTEQNEEELDKGTQVGLESNTEAAVEAEEEEETDGEQETENQEEETSETDFEAEYKKLMAPFKAAGKEITLRTPEELIRLAQQGVSYNEKMRGMKPHQKVLKMLENNGLLDESKLSYLIDLDKKNPEAISKLLKDSEIDPLSINTDEESKYTPSDHSVSDSEVELDDVISRIQDTASFTDTMDLVNNKWDDTSKRTLVSNPQLLETLNAHMSNGTFEMVKTEMDRVRVLGGLANLSDLEAYQQVGMLMQQQGAFNAQAQTPKSVSTKPNVAVDKERKDKKRKAGPSKRVASQAKQEFDPMIALSDEEFMQKFAKT